MSGTKQKKILITGAAGFVGANLARACAAAGDEVHALVRPGRRSFRLADAPGLALAEVDISDASAVAALVTRIAPDVVYHLAHYGGNRGETDAARIRAVIVDGTKSLYAACRALASVPVIVHAGSSSEYGMKTEAMREDMTPEPTTDYGKAKLEATELGERLRRDGMPITTLRLFSVYGPYEAATRLIPAVTFSLLDGNAPTLSDPTSVRDFIHVEDVVAALRRAAVSPAGVYNVGTGIQTTLKEAVEAIARTLASDIPLVWGGDPGRGFETMSWRADTAKAATELGFTASIAFPEGIKRAVEWLRDHRELYAG